MPTRTASSPDKRCSEQITAAGTRPLHRSAILRKSAHPAGRPQVNMGRPRARGDAPCRLVSRTSPGRSRGVGPAHARGCSRRFAVDIGLVPATSAPRTRGCSAVRCRTRITGAGSAPRTRGCSEIDDRSTTAAHVGPAHAGMLPFRRRAADPESWSAPRTRGCSGGLSRWCLGRRVGPAHAGTLRGQSRARQGQAARVGPAHAGCPAWPYSVSVVASALRTRGCSLFWSSPPRTRPVGPAHAGMVHPSASSTREFQGQRLAATCSSQRRVLARLVRSTTCLPAANSSTFASTLGRMRRR